MKRKTLLGTIVTSVVVLLVVVLLVNSLLSPSGEVPIVFAAAPPEVPSQVDILKTVSRGITKEKALDLASTVFNMTGEFKNTEYGSWILSENNREVEFYSFGDISYFDLSDSEAHPREEFPSELECKEIAQRFFEKLGVEGLTFQQSLDVSFEKIDYANESRWELVDGTYIVTETLVYEIYVKFALSYKGIRLSKGFYVTLGKAGKIKGFSGHFWEAEAYETVQILTPDDAVKKLDIVGRPTKAIVESIELEYDVYWLGTTATTYIKPAYDLVVAYIMKDGTVIKHLQTVQAC